MAINNALELPLSPELKHIQDNYIESFNFLHFRKRRQVQQLVLLNNLQRGDQNIASTLLLTLFNRMMSSLYDDHLQVKFLPAQGITQDQLTAFNTLAQSDYVEMNKAKLDYDWVWDALFFGRGYMETYRFNKKRKLMEPNVINPLVFGYDPYFEEVQDWRYYWKWIIKSENELKRLIKNGTIDGISDPKEIPGGVDEFLWNYKLLRDKAKKAIEPGPSPLAKDVYQIMEYYGYDEDGDKCCYWLDRSFTKVLYKEKLKFDDLVFEDGKVGSKWPIVVKQSFREPHSSVNFSVADLLEDKHRAKSVLLNLAYIAAKDKANPIYQYNPDLIKDVTQFFARQIDQHIPVEDIGKAIAPLNVEEPMSAGLIQFIYMMEAEANNPMGSGMPMGNLGTRTNRPTATQMAIEQQMNDLALSLQGKVMQFGEQEFWSHWFHRYAKHAKSLGVKMANIVGVKGVSSTEIDLSMFDTDYPPGVMVYSQKDAEYKESVLRQDLMQIYPELQQTLDQSGMRNFNKYVFFPKFLKDPSLTDIVLPKTIDELKAEGENERLAKNEMFDAVPTDDHETHIYIHNMVQPKTWAVWFHISEHEQMLDQQKSQQQAQQMQQMQQQQQPQQGVQVGQPNQPMSRAQKVNTNNSPAVPAKNQNNPQRVTGAMANTQQ